MFKDAFLKLDRAVERITELNEFLSKNRPFSYVVETNTETRERATYAKKDEALVDRAAVIAGDAGHNIRTSLDAAYWEIVSPFADGIRQQRAIQFPFSETAARLEEAVKNRLAHKVSQGFFDAMVSLKPHCEGGGNRLLYLIDQVDIPDKHRGLTPVADYKAISGTVLSRQVPDIPFVGDGVIHLGNNWRDIGWVSDSIDRNAIGKNVPPTLHIFEKELDVPVEIVFAVRKPNFSGPLVPTLNQLVDVAKETIEIMGRAAT